MDLKIEGKIALVTGAGRGIGRSICECLAAEGVRIIAITRAKDTLSSLQNSLASCTSQDHLFLSLNLQQPSDIATLKNLLVKQEIVPDIVVHNLGGNLGVTDPLCTLDQWRAVWQVNMEIPIEVNRICIPQMQSKKWGRVCHISSVAGLENQGPPAYCAAKAGLIAYVRSLGRYVAKDNVVINAVLPGAIFTKGGYWDIASQTKKQHVEKYLNERMAIQRFGKPEEIGKLVAFLCSDLSSFCVGSSFLADGGQGRVFFNQEAD